LYNAVALLQGGRVATVVRKSLLPTYDVFDEARYFDPAPESGPLIEIAGARLGVSICEDLWNDKQFWKQPRYLRDPIEELVANGEVQLEAAAFREDLIIHELTPRPRQPTNPEARTAGASVISDQTAETPAGALAVIAAYESDFSDENCRELADALTLGIRDYT